MTLKKGFIYGSSVIDSKRIITGVLLWILTSYILYAFFYLYKEAIRISMADMGGKMLLVLNEQEHYTYNLFYASVASSVGFMLSAKFIVEISISRSSFRTRMLQKRILNEIGYFIWPFLLWFGKLFSLLGIWYLMYPLQYDIDFLKEFSLLLILLPIVVFFSTWPILGKAFGLKKYKWMGLSFLIFLVMSCSFAFKEFIDVEKINRNLLKRSIEYTYDLRLPVTKHFQILQRRSAAVDVYVLLDSAEHKTPVIFWENERNQIELNQLKNIAFDSKESAPEYMKHSLTINLIIDERINFSIVKSILNQLRQVGIYKIHFSTGAANSRYPSYYTGFKYLGIKERLFFLYPEFVNFLDSAEMVDLGSRRINIPESIYYRIPDLEKENHIVVKTDENSITVNKQKMSKDKFAEFTYDFMNKYSPNYIILYEPKSDISYGRYIEIKDVLLDATDRLRNKLSYELFGKSFEEERWNYDYDTIRLKFPTRILEWTLEEERLIELRNKAENSKKMKD